MNYHGHWSQVRHSVDVIHCEILSKRSENLRVPSCLFQEAGLADVCVHRLAEHDPARRRDTLIGTAEEGFVRVSGTT
jgi:hypothetical protein